MTLTWSTQRARLIIAVGCLFVAGSFLGTDEAAWQRAGAGVLGIAAAGFGIARLRRVGEPVLELDSSGLRDSRLTPGFIPRSAIQSITFEPPYWAGGALLIELADGAPEVQVSDPHFVMRGRESKVRGSHVRLSLDGLAFSSSVVREALVPYSNNAAA